MATHQFTIHPFRTLHSVGDTGTDRAPRPLHAIPPIGSSFTCSAPRGTVVSASDNQPDTKDGILVVTTDAANPEDWRGKALWIACRLTAVVVDGPGAGLTVRMFVIRIGSDGDRTPEDLGLISTVPLRAGVEYRVLELADEARALPASLALGGGQSGRNAGAAPPPEPELLACFTHGTLIDTPDGSRPIEDLAPGDLVTTLVNGSKPLRWIGRWAVSRAEMLSRPELQPVLFDAGVLGNTRPLLVSPLHRMLLNDWRAQVYFGEDEVLIAAKGLVNGRTIRQILPEDGVTYCQLLFDRHEVILAEGALSESLHPGEIALDEVRRREIEACFPGLAFLDRRAAFPIVRTAEATGLPLAG